MYAIRLSIHRKYSAIVLKYASDNEACASEWFQDVARDPDLGCDGHAQLEQCGGTLDLLVGESDVVHSTPAVSAMKCVRRSQLAKDENFESDL